MQLKFNFREYEEGILNFFNDENGLKLYVHDKKKRMSKYDFSIFWYERIVIYFNL